MVRHVRFGRRDVRERRETFVSFVAPRPGVSRHAVTVTARNARRFVRHGVSITRVWPRSDDRVSLYQSLRPVAILLPPFDYCPSFPPRARRAVRFCPTHVSTVHLHPLLGFAYVCPVCQPVLLTDVRIDNLCPLIMTVRSRARRYLTVRVIAISSSILHPSSPPPPTTKVQRYRSSSGNLFRLNPRRNPGDWRFFPNVFSFVKSDSWDKYLEILRPLEMTYRTTIYKIFKKIINFRADKRWIRSHNKIVK